MVDVAYSMTSSAKLFENICSTQSKKNG